MSDIGYSKLPPKLKFLLESDNVLPNLKLPEEAPEAFERGPLNVLEGEYVLLVERGGKVT